jgi:hypothetical protein
MDARAYTWTRPLQVQLSRDALVKSFIAQTLDRFAEAQQQQEIADVPRFAGLLRTGRRWVGSVVFVANEVWRR